MYAKGIDASRLESYLSDEQFLEVLTMTKAGFYAMPQWKRAKILKAKDLF
jgi:hypothetical protein